MGARKNVLPALPTLNAFCRVRTENQDKFFAFVEFGQRVRRVGPAISMNLPRVGLEVGHILHGQAGHFPAVIGVAHPAVGFLPRCSGRHEGDDVEIEIAISHLTREQVSDMRWIKGPAEDAPAHADRIGASSPVAVWNQTQGLGGIDWVAPDHPKRVDIGGPDSDREVQRRRAVTGTAPADNG